ncbi:3-hydroxyacyl-[acyl-carrier-protein] dehydratase [Tumebacillus sp. BK434]|uniref:3-hydroxyacyl-ACP dehydratase FabZ family protein n=1 Tax=Tumebacillus sp. BK434 TaxID=2512169 RepID=UPI0010495065|nr:hypothetical protein [Tumebacillus sp. BK434]TCP57829.1 3-hydroxyacyl-[acyl-carrier-protein] dehydratase [Tumebacillus sp. BK434]
MDVQSILPHRAPFLFVQEIVDIVPGERAEAISALPSAAVAEGTVPLWYAAEFLAQTGALAVLAGGPEGERTLMTGIEGMRLLAEASPGRPLRAEVTVLGERRGIGKRHGRVWQGETLVAEGVIWYARTRD